ncbi:TVP38/TMEM64 family protein [Neptunicella marina]|uniref:TVP38/TMEM64 family membrane protein n=1 Tax=Neptunicella marina TaxID=2125989 RepID=A0A8J6IUJ5_9ALTE|nr:VTT domain-containing protein [Neptunicella marina]MBC3766951.1 TVP38/TMEM64 family protein [Neptunicella marina]
MHKILKGLLFVSIVLIFGYLLTTSQLFENLNKNWIDLHIRNNGIQGIGYYVLITAIAASIGAPRQLLAFLGGYAFGFVNGTLLSTIATTLGCALTFHVARFLLRPAIKRKYGHRTQKVDVFLTQQPMLKTIIIRLLPVGNNMVTNLVAGVTHIKARYFITGSAIGYLPQMAIFALMGKGIVVLSTWKIALSVLLFFVSSYLSWHLYRQYKAARQLDELTSSTQNLPDTHPGAN